MANNLTHRSGTVLEITESRVGSYAVKLLSEGEGLPKRVGYLGKDRYPFQGSSGAIFVDGYFDPLRFEIGSRIIAFGIDLGIFYGEVEEGICVEVDLGFVKGEIRLRVTPGMELWLEPRLGTIAEMGKYSLGGGLENGNGNENGDGDGAAWGALLGMERVKLAQFPRARG